MKNQHPTLNNLIESMRLLATRYRAWADEYSGDRAAEYARLAADMERTAAELELFRQRQSKD